MATKTSIIIDGLDNADKKKQMTITNVKPTATDAQCYAFGAAIAALSTRTLTNIARVSRTDLEAPQGGE